WFSTIFGVYIFSGMVLSGLAAITIGVIWLRAKGFLGDGIVTRDHLYSLGALLFAFTCFWTYIAFSQFMLIWYGNIPEETIYFVHRTEHSWLGISLLLITIRFVVPFFVLLSREAKMKPRALVTASVLVLAGELVDLYWLIMPQVHGDAPKLSWQELGPPILLTGILILYIGRFLSRHRVLAVGDPWFDKSRKFHL
ncbi:MAG: quinol:cytochrome C oxidoreductase, partial [Planctomycetota bacterium]